MRTVEAVGREYREDVEYGCAEGHSLRMDYSIPADTGPFPAVIVVHGGGWVMGDRKQTIEPLFPPLTEAQFAWFSISYRLAAQLDGESDVERTVSSLLMLGSGAEDVRTAIAHVKEHAAKYRVDPNRVALLGESAGAQLASLAALKPDPGGQVQAVAALYAPFDLVTLARTSRHIPDSVRDAVKGTVWEQMLVEALRELSPVSSVRPDAPPFLLIHGTADALVPFSQSEEMQREMQRVGADCDLLPIEGGGHGIRWWEWEKRTAYKALMVKWLKERLG